MKRTRVLVFAAIVAWGGSLQAGANRYTEMEPLRLKQPVMEPRLDYTVVKETRTNSSALIRRSVNVEPAALATPATDEYRQTWMRTNEGVKPYKFMDDMTFVGVPLFVAGWAVKGDKAMFRVNNKEGKRNTQLLTDFKTSIDDYTQYFGPAMVVGLKLGGVEGRSDWGRLLASAGLSYGIMAGFVNGIKYTAKEMRPDGSSANSWPSGHTATSFVGATLLHKEYGLTRSPWYSVAGYGVATATGVMRVLNNRHWVSDVMSGAGIGILSAELGYAIGDLIFKGNGLLRNNLELDSENPSFFGISMGLGLGGKDIGFNIITDLQDKEQHGFDDELVDYYKDWDEASINIDFRSATVVDAEGAYFFNKYVGLGGRFRVRAMSAKSFGQYADISSEDANDIWKTDISDIYRMAGQTLTTDVINAGGAPITKAYGVVKSDHLAEFTGSVGLYLNLPLGYGFSLGTKFLVGRSITQELDIDGHAEGNVKDMKYSMLIKDGKVSEREDGGLAFDLSDPQSTGETYSADWDYLKLGSDNSTSYGTGFSLTYRYKSNFAWKLFCDYDYSKKTYTMTYDPYNFMRKALTPSAYNLVCNTEVSELGYMMTPMVFKKDKKMNYWTIGLSFVVNL